MTLLAVRPLDPAWSPTSQQSDGSSVTFMQDPAGDAALGLTPGLGGLIAGSGGAPSTVAGKYLQAFQPTASTRSMYWLPLVGLLNPDEWTIAFWASFPLDWTNYPSTALLTLGEGSNNLQFQTGGGPQLSLVINHCQNPASPSSYSVSCNASTFHSGDFPGATPQMVAATFKAGVVSLYANGTLLHQTSGVVAPACWDATNSSDGVWMPASIAGVTPTALSLSDVWIDRHARVPSVQSFVSSGRSTITVNSTPTGTTVQPLNGGLKKPSPGIPGSTADLVGNAAVLASGAVKKIRFGQILQVTPILAGGTPDATHPTVGHSGSYCYDWQVVDRTLRRLDALGIEAYVNISGVPNILGGTQVPFSNTVETTTAAAQAPDVTTTLALTGIPSGISAMNYAGYGGNVYYFTAHAGTTLQNCTLVSGTPGLTIPPGASVNVGNLLFATSYDKQAINPGPPTVPTVAAGITALATMIKDLAYHIYNEMSPALSNPPVYWTPWNEPDGGIGNWENNANTVTDYCSLYQQMATGVKAINASAKMAGPEIHTWSVSKTSFVQPFIAFCGANSVPLDAFSWHYYSGDLSEPYQIRIQVDAWLTAAGLTPGIPLINGEWSWEIANILNAPWYQGTNGTISNYLLNDFHAAFVAAAFIQQQAAGTVFTNLCDPGSGAPNNMDVLFDKTTGVAQSNWNVFLLWEKIRSTYPTLVGCSGPQTVACDPGIFAQASKDGSGHYAILIANLHYRKQGKGAKSSYPVLVQGIPVADSTTVTAYMIDDGHSNAYDAGSANAALQTVDTTIGPQGVNKIVGGKVGIPLRPRAACLLVTS